MNDDFMLGQNDILSLQHGTITMTDPNRYTNLIKLLKKNGFKTFTFGYPTQNVTATFIKDLNLKVYYKSRNKNMFDNLFKIFQGF